MKLVDCFLEIITFVRLVSSSKDMVTAEYDAVRQDLDLLIKRLDDKVTAGGFSYEQFNNARFAVFAWVDEAILCSNWHGVNEWLRNTLQREYYGTSNAGEEFYKKLKELIPDESSLAEKEHGRSGSKSVLSSEDDSLIFSRKEVIEVYALCMSLGYNGAYFSEHDRTKLKEIHQDSLDRIISQTGSGKDAVFPLAYNFTKGSKRKKSFGRTFDFWSIIFFILPVLVLSGIFYIYRDLLEKSLELWLS
ncbi:MAG: DotU family type IV/VI secretion system protein [Desulfotalea sp.]